MPYVNPSLLLGGDYRDWLLTGLRLSLLLSLISLACALPLATLVALLRMAPSRVANRLDATPEPRVWTCQWLWRW